MYVVAFTHTKEKINIQTCETVFTSDIEKLKSYDSFFDLVIDTIPFTHDTNPFIKLVKK